MELKIISKKNNPLFGRSEVSAAVSGFSATPSRKEVSELLCSELKCVVDSLVISEIHQPFGSKTVNVQCKVYESPEKAKATESGYLFQRGQPKPAAGV